jgi:hypothetical protein
MNQQNQQPEKQKERRYDPELLKKGFKCDLDQYEILKRCSDKKDMTQWNSWLQEHSDEGIWLEGAELSFTNLENAWLKYARMKEVFLNYSNLNEAKLRCAVLEGAKGGQIHLKGTDLLKANIKGAKLTASIVDGSTILWKCEVDRETDFEGVALDSCRIDPATKQLLEYNIRHKNWEEWYKEHSFLKWLVKTFWWISDYGISTKRIIFTFFGLAIVFAISYRLFPSFVMVYGTVGDIRGFWHALYFSVVTMTTLGFGDIAANPDSWAGQTLLMIQMILGYVLLGALVTRFAVLFTAGGPAGKFADEKSIWERISSKIGLKSKEKNGKL